MIQFWHSYGVYIAPLLVALIDYAVGRFHPSENVMNLITWAESFLKSPPSPPPAQ